MLKEKLFYPNFDQEKDYTLLERDVIKVNKD